MAEHIVDRPDTHAGPSVVRTPKLPSAPVPGSIEPVSSSSRPIGTFNDNSRPVNPQTGQPLQFVESSASSSGDEIAPCDEQSTPAPFKKSRHGKYAYSDRYDLSEYEIEQLSEYDDIDLVKPWHRKLILIHPFVILWVFFAYAAYYGYRVWCNYQYRLVYGGLAEASWIFIVVEGVILRKPQRTPTLQNLANIYKFPTCHGWLFCSYRSGTASAQNCAFVAKQYLRLTCSSPLAERLYL